VLKGRFRFSDSAFILTPEFASAQSYLFGTKWLPRDLQIGLLPDWVYRAPARPVCRRSC
jgi:hypothetical protein